MKRECLDTRVARSEFMVERLRTSFERVKEDYEKRGTPRTVYKSEEIFYNCLNKCHSYGFTHMYDFYADKYERLIEEHDHNEE